MYANCELYTVLYSLLKISLVMLHITKDRYFNIHNKNHAWLYLKNRKSIRLLLDLHNVLNSLVNVKSEENKCS